MSLLRDFLVAPRTGGAAVDDRARRTRRARAAAPAEDAAATALGLLAPTRDLPAAAAAVGIAIARTAPAALVCFAAAVPSPGLRAPARTAAARLAESLRARDIEAFARGRVALAALPDEDPARAAARAIAAAGPLPTVLAVSARDDEIDAVLATRDAILVALPASVEPALARLALAGAEELVAGASRLAHAAPLPLVLDPVQRTLALAGVRAPRAISTAVTKLVA